MPGGPMADDPHNQDEDPRSGDSHEQGPSSDPGRIATQQDFGRELTLARRRAGLTVREVARAAGIPASTAGDYFSGRHLPPPSQPDSLPRILAACGVTDLGLLREWASALVRVRRAPGRRAVGASAPYRGLASFEPEDAEWFFGREELTAHLLIRATAGTTAAGTTAAGTTAAGTTAAGTTAAGTTAAGPTGTDGTGDTVGVPLVVIGSSGSGKSSLLRAGLIPRLLAADPTRPLALFTPGASPLADLARQLSRLGLAAGTDASETEAALRSDPEGSARLVGQVSYASRAGPAIVVDQFEEAFTDCLDEDERRAFITALCALSGPAVVVLALRADFYDRALSHPGLSRALQQRQVVVGPMTWEQVRRAIVEPARKARLDVDDGLVELLLRDLAPAAGGGNPPGAGPEPGVLPLLSHALLATWQNGHGGTLTVTDYQASGGIHDAIARTAEAVYEELADEQRGIARRLRVRRRCAGQVRGRAPDHPGRGHGPDQPRGTHYRVAPAAGLDRQRPGGPADPAAHHRDRPCLGRGRPGQRGAAPWCAAGHRQGLGRRPGQSVQPDPAGPGVRGHRHRPGETSQRSRTKAHPQTAPSGGHPHRAGARDRRPGRVRIPAARGGHHRAQRRTVAGGSHRGEPDPRPVGIPRRAAQPGRLPDRPDRAGPGRPTGSVRHPGRRAAGRLGRRGAVGEPQPGPPGPRGGRRGRDAAAMGCGAASAAGPARPIADGGGPEPVVHHGIRPERAAARSRGYRRDRAVVGRE